MSNLYKKILLVPVVVFTLLLVPIGGFQQIITTESTATASESKDNPVIIINNGTSSNPEKPIQQETINQFEEKDKQSNSDKITEKKNKQLSNNEITKAQKLYPDTDNRNEKTAYLTFDDGPSPLVTPKILAVLRQHDLKATFFVIGSMAEQNPELMRQIHKEGHLICNHTYSHNYKYIYSNPDNFMADVTKWEEVLKTILDEDFETNILRFPGGSFGKKRLCFRERAREKGYLNIDWNVLNGDAEALHVPANMLIDRFRGTLKNKDNAIVLMHDSNTKDTTAEALPKIIDYLQSEGYSFKTLENYALQSNEVRK
jgi:peptidoglycan/xylan/chitin deacetylase (PgdA/CDA1 family)